MKFKFELGDLIKIPNILCYLRILMVPLFLHIYFTAERPQDFFDGQIARRCNMITDLGRIIDPLADKLMQLAMLVALTVRVKYMYLLVIFLVLKEVISAVTGFFVMKFAKKRLNGAKWYGKVCTAILYVVMLALVAFPQMEVHVQDILLLVCAGALMLAFVMYVRLYIIMIVDARNGRNEKILY